MKYTITTFDKQENEHTTTLSVRQGAKNKTIFSKCAMAMLDKLREDGLTSPAEKFTWGGSLPNLWTNGYVGYLYITSATGDTYNISIQEENGAWLAL